MTIVIAHRTCPRHAVENSLAGIEMAAALGADAVEMDVRLTRDGRAVLHHDALVRGAAGRRLPLPVRWMGEAAARSLAVRTGRTPLLADALAAASLAGIWAVLDVKTVPAASAVVALQPSSPAAQVSLWSQHEEAVACLVRAGCAQDAVALLRDTSGPVEGERLLRDAERLGAGGVSAHWDAVDARFVRRAADAGLKVYSWCQWPDRHAEKLGLGLAGVVTDWPDLARRAGY